MLENVAKGVNLVYSAFLLVGHFSIPLLVHIAISALAGYGLAKRLGWQFYLIASFLHGATNYSTILLQKGLMTGVQVEIYIAVLAVAISATALWLRWRQPKMVVQEFQ